MILYFSEPMHESDKASGIIRPEREARLPLRSSPLQLWCEPVQQHVETTRGRWISAPQGDTCPPRETAGLIDLARSRQRGNACQKNL
jgi:hypothetical protein